MDSALDMLVTMCYTNLRFIIIIIIIIIITMIIVYKRIRAAVISATVLFSTQIRKTDQRQPN